MLKNDCTACVCVCVCVCWHRFLPSCGRRAMGGFCSVVVSQAMLCLQLYKIVFFSSPVFLQLLQQLFNTTARLTQSVFIVTGTMAR